MATLVKIRGLQRVNPSATGSVMSNRGFRVNQAGKQQFPAGVKASITGGTGASTLTVTARYGGTYANGSTIGLTVATDSSTPTSLESQFDSTGQYNLNVVASSSASAGDIARAINNDNIAKEFVVAAAGGEGTDLSDGMLGDLAGGTDVGAGQPIERVVSSDVTVLVDLDDAFTLRQLRRNAGQYISLGEQL